MSVVQKLKFAQFPHGTACKRTSSRLRRTNDRSVLAVHEDHEDDENAEIGVSLHASITLSDIWYHAPILGFTYASQIISNRSEGFRAS